jgi:membrane-bound metal-dependent hydrolase YbcI (DUF457 family)
MDTLTHIASGGLVGAVIAQTLMPEAYTSFVVLGCLAGSIPDLDFLAEFKSKLAAWKYHRILVHNVLIAFFISSVLALFSSVVLTQPILLVVLLCFVATGLHLLLDVLTSFGTCLLYPFSHKRFTTRSHFIFDPIVLALSVVGVMSDLSVVMAVSLGGYLIAGIQLRQYFSRYSQRQLPTALQHQTVHLEPRFLAPFRWLVIVHTPKGYAYCYQTLMWQSTWYFQAHENESFLSICQQNELMVEVLTTFDFPLVQIQKKEDAQYLVIEDLKWRLEPSLRPLAFTAKLHQNETEYLISHVKQGGFFQKNDGVLFIPTKTLNQS